MADVLSSAGVSGTPGALPLGWSKVSVTADFTQAAWNTVAAHRLFTVTGAVLVKLVPRIGGSAIGSGGAATLSMGVTGSLASIIAATAMAVFAAITNSFWVSNTVAAAFSSLGALMVGTAKEMLISGGAGAVNICLEILVAALNAGTLTVDCFWQPLSDGATVVAASGGVA